MIVSSFMVPASKVVKCEPSDPVEAVIDKILENNISAVVVLNEEGVAVGMVTKTDIVKAYKEGRALNSGVECFMSTDLKTVKSNASRDQAATLFEENKLHHAIVVEDSGKFCGLISAWDIAKECAEDMKAWPWHRHQGGKVTVKMQ